MHVRKFVKVAIAAIFGVHCGIAFAATFQVDALGKTVLFYDEDHGNQVEFYDQSGRCLLWHPGNTKTVPGQWLTNGNDICFRYGKNTYNPATGARGDDWHCSPINEWKRRIVDMSLGDSFGLSLNGTPYKLKAKPKFDSIADLKKQAPQIEPER